MNAMQKPIRKILMYAASAFMDSLAMKGFGTKNRAMSKGAAIGILTLAVLVFIIADIEAVYISVLFGLRLVVLLRLPLAYYAPAALVETIVVVINPAHRVFSFEDSSALYAHLIGIAATYLAGWFLRCDGQLSNKTETPSFFHYLLFISTVTLATITAMLAFIQFTNPQDFFYLISAAYAKLAIYSLSAMIFGFFAAYVIDRPGYTRQSIVMALAIPALLYLLYQAGLSVFSILNNISAIYLFLLILIGGLVFTAYRYGALTTWVGCLSAAYIVSIHHNGWSLSTWHAVINYLIFLFTFTLYIAFFIDRINQAHSDLMQSKKREDRLIRNMQNIVHTQNVDNTERLDRIVRDLHDEVGQSLVAASIYIRSLENSLDSAKAQRAFEKGSAMLETTSLSIRSMLQSLNRESINYTYLSQELKSGRIAQLLNGSGIDYRFSLAPESNAWSELSPEVYSYIHRFFQETVTNLLRHSRATQCRINLRLRTTAGYIFIIGSISDNDIERNFDFNKKGSTGLDGLVQKARYLEGMLRHGRKPTFKKIGFLLRIPKQ